MTNTVDYEIPIGPWVDICAQKLKGLPPLVTRNYETGMITDHALGQSFRSSEDYARRWGHQQHTPELPVEKADMKLWSLDRKRGDCWKPDKITAGAVNAAHKNYFDDETNLDDYTSLLASFLTQFNQIEDVYAFLTSVSDKLELKTFCPNNTFAKTLKVRCDEFTSDESAAPTTIRLEDDEPQEPADSDEKMNFPAIKRTQTRRALTAAYVSHRDEPSDTNGQRLFRQILDFSVGKISTQMRGLDEVAVTPQDVSQNVAIYIWQNLADFRGKPKGFYPWLHKITYSASMEAIRGYRATANIRAPLLVPSREEGEEGLLEDNPECYTAGSRQHVKELPAFIQGHNRIICEYIAEGVSYQKIAALLDISESAVKARVAWMKRTNEKFKIITPAA